MYAPTPITEEKGTRIPENGEKIPMVDAGIHAIQELMHKHPEALLYGQDVGGRIGGVFREAVTLQQNLGTKEFSTLPFKSIYYRFYTVGMSAVGLKPIVEVQFGRLYLSRNQSIK